MASRPSRGPDSSEPLEKRPRYDSESDGDDSAASSIAAVIDAELQEETRPTSITLCAGFAKIMEGPKFYGPDTEKKGKKIVDHVANIREIQNGHEVIITATCIPAMKINNDPYIQRITLDSSRRVTDAQCTSRPGKPQCPVGIQGKCKHIAAVIEKVNSERTTSKTDEAQAWLKPSEQLTQLYPKGETIQELFSGKKGEPRNFKPPQDNLDHFATLLKKHKLTNASAYKSITIDKSGVDVPAPDPVVVHPRILEMLSSNLVIYSSHDSGRWFNALSQSDHDFYNEKVKIPPGKEKEIFVDTMGQTINKMWHEERENRVTSTKAKKIVRGQRTATRVGYMYPKKGPISNKNFRYGHEMEPKARQKYEEQENVQVHEAGLVVCHEQPWIACSPDGLVVDNNDDIILLEIKCPISCQSDKINVDYVEFRLCPETGLLVPALKKTDDYYMQIQIQLYLCKAKICHLFIFSMADTLTVKVEFDHDFL